MSSSFIQHFNIEAKYNNSIRSMSLLNEEHGYIPNLDAYVNDFITAFKEELDSQIEERKTRGFMGMSFNFSFDETIFKSIKPFFDIAYISVMAGIISNYDKPSYTGEYKSDRSGNTSKGYKIVINLSVTGKYDDVLKTLRSEFAHELTHAYEDYNRSMNHERSVDMVGFMDGSQKAGDIYGYHFDSEDIPKMVSSILYQTSDVESNAYIGMIKADLNYATMKQCYDAKDVQRAIKNTEGYKRYEEVVNYMSQLENETDPSKQQEILDIFNKTRMHGVGYMKDTPVKTFKKAIRIMRNKVDDFQRRFISQSSKMAYDAFSQANANTTDTGNPDRIRDLMSKINDRS